MGRLLFFAYFGSDLACHVTKSVLSVIAAKPEVVERRGWWRWIEDVKTLKMS